MIMYQTKKKEYFVIIKFFFVETSIENYKTTLVVILDNPHGMQKKFEKMQIKELKQKPNMKKFLQVIG